MNQITIIAYIDTSAALKANSLSGNIYLLDNQSTDGSVGEGTDQLVTAINSSYLCDGAQATDIVLNWFIVDIGALPPTLPRSYRRERSMEIDRQWLHTARSGFARLIEGANAQAPGEGDQLTPETLGDLLKKVGRFDKVQDELGTHIRLGVKPLTVFGQPFGEHQDPSNLSYLPPHVSNITGQAVDDGVIFPAQYGSPVPIKDGWYWSATVDTHLAGVHAYTLEITLYHCTPQGEGTFVWTPVRMTHQALLRIDRQPQRNGFTHAGMGLIPVVI